MISCFWILAAPVEPWHAATTADNLKHIARSRQTAGQDVAELREFIAELESRVAINPIKGA